jgi:hypothetical protein
MMKRLVYVVDDCYDSEDREDAIKENKSCFTLSFDPDNPGWETDGGYKCYGLTYKVACKMVEKLNENGGLEITDEDLEDRS